MAVKESDRKCLIVNIDVAEYDIAEKISCYRFAG